MLPHFIPNVLQSTLSQANSKVQEIAFNFYLIVTSKPVSTDNWFIGSVLTDMWHVYLYQYACYKIDMQIKLQYICTIIRPHTIVKRGIFPNANQMKENMKFTCIYFIYISCVCVIVMSWNNLWRNKMHLSFVKVKKLTWCLWFCSNSTCDLFKVFTFQCSDREQFGIGTFM